MTDTVHVRGEGGTVIAMDLPLPEPIADRLAKGQLTRVNPDGTPYVVTEADPEVPGPPTKAPAKADSKAAWVAWAVVCGADPEEAEALTKADLAEQYGAAAE